MMSFGVLPITLMTLWSNRTLLTSENQNESGSTNHSF